MDAEGYNFGPDTLASTEEDRWVPSFYRNPAAEVTGSDHTGEVGSKHAEWSAMTDWSSARVGTTTNVADPPSRN